ncbi:MAG: nucleotidyltransferase domain-containing protein [Flavobacteriales bacterium]|nr:nucleotidyltransferase domain-containing protein [Flavobacteriales bacterium]
MDLNSLERRKLILLKCVSGSRAYGLDTATSDEDIRGVFYLPFHDFFGLNYTSQISDERNDVVFFELKRYVELLCLNNPNMMELLATPPQCVLIKSNLLSELTPEVFLSKRCKQTFGNYAISQIQKARGLNKKIMNPMDKERKSVEDFCYVSFGGGSLPLKLYLQNNQWIAENCGLVNIPNMPNVFGLYYHKNGGYNGVSSGENANDVCLTSIPKGENQITMLYFNKDAYSAYCKNYREYWNWVEVRNEERFKNTMSHGKNYDAKNMMHTFRLLDMAIEIGKEGKLMVRRPNRDFLLKVKRGEFEFDYLMGLIEEKQHELEEVYAQSQLQEEPDLIKANEILVEIRKELMLL